MRWKFWMNFSESTDPMSMYDWGLINLFLPYRYTELTSIKDVVYTHVWNAFVIFINFEIPNSLPVTFWISKMDITDYILNRFIFFFIQVRPANYNLVY